MNPLESGKEIGTAEPLPKIDPVEQKNVPVKDPKPSERQPGEKIETDHPTKSKVQRNREELIENPLTTPSY